MALKAKSVHAEKVDDAVFKIDTSEHKKIPFEELEKMLNELNPSSSQ